MDGNEFKISKFISKGNFLYSLLDFTSAHGTITKKLFIYILWKENSDSGNGMYKSASFPYIFKIT